MWLAPAAAWPHLFFRGRDSDINVGAAEGFGIRNSLFLAVVLGFSFHSSRDRFAVGPFLTRVFCQRVNFDLDGAADIDPGVWSRCVVVIDLGHFPRRQVALPQVL